MSERVLLARIKEWMSSVNEKTEQKRKLGVVYIYSPMNWEFKKTLVWDYSCYHVSQCIGYFPILLRVSYSNDMCQFLIGPIFDSVMGGQNQNLLVIDL
jgi:hypothetical protein